MAGAPEREQERTNSSSRPLHNFTLPTRLKWANQRHLRCMKNPYPSRSTPSNSAASSGDHRRHRSNSPLPVARRSPTTIAPIRRVKDKSPITIASTATSGNATEIEAVREKLMSDLKVAADQLKLPMLEGSEKESKVNFNADEKKPSEEELPWTLRTRRAAGGKVGNDGANAGSSPLRRQERGLRSLAAGDKGEASGSSDQQRPKFSPTLSKEEIETDFLLMTGAKPPRRPKKRPKSVQKQLDALFPGAWLTEVTPESYKVPDVPEPKGEK